MPRKLPWLAQDVKTPRTKSSSSSPALKRKHASSPDDLVDEDLNTVGAATPKGRASKQSRGRTPSTSPPPALAAPPEGEYMHEGFRADDAWMMVEDEFFSTAQMFTQHIHHAEYVRLKKLARARGAGTLQDIARPTDGRTEPSVVTKLRLEAEARLRKARNGVASLAEPAESDEGEDEYMNDPQLAGLMTGSQLAGQELTRIVKARTNTRAAAGFSKCPQKPRWKDMASESALSYPKQPTGQQRPSPDCGQNSETDDGDLDATPRSTTPSKSQQQRGSIKHPLSRSSFATGDDEASSKPARASDTLKRLAKPSLLAQRADDENARGEEHVLLRSPKRERAVYVGTESSPPVVSRSPRLYGIARKNNTSDYLAKRRAARDMKEKENKEKEKKKKKQAVEVPTFAI